MGKRNFLRKGEGHIAAHESAKVTQEKEEEEKAKKDIASYSLQHAKKGGLIKPSTANRSNILSNSSESMSGNYDQNGIGSNGGSGEQSTGGRSRPTSGTSQIKGGVVYKEMDSQFDKKWDDVWTEEDELNFLKARGDG